MAIWRLVEDRNTRIVVVLAWSIAAIIWLLGPEFVFSLGNIDGGISESTQFQYRAAVVLAFVAVVAILAYVLLGTGHRGTADSVYYKPLINRATLAAAYAEPAGTLCYANPAFLRLFELSQTAVGQISLQELLRSWVHTPPLTGLLPAMGSVELRAHLDAVEGQAIDVLLTITPARDELEGFLLFATDMTAHRRLEAAEALLGGAVQSLSQGLIVCDASRAGLPIVFANMTAQAMTGFSLAELLTMPWSVLHGSDRDQPGLTQLRTALKQKRPGTAVVRYYRKDGTSIDANVSSSLVADQSGTLTHVTFLQSEITGEALERDALNREFYFDDVSGLLNRAGYLPKLTALLGPPVDRRVFVAVIDIQGFEMFNTAASWDVGDAFIEAFARRLSAALPTALLGRLDTKQFTAALSMTSGEAEDRADTILKAVTGRFFLPGMTYDPVVTIGYTVAAGGSLARTALQQASVALSEARANAVGCSRPFDPATETRLNERRRLITELQRAVEDRNFVVHYEPKVDLRTGLIVGAEALARWHHPLFGMQQPPGLVGLAEETGVIVDIGRFVLAEAAQFAAKINHGRRVPIPVAVTIALAQLFRPGFVAQLERELEGAGSLPPWIQLEMTEATLSAAPAKSLAILSQLQAIGIGLAIDDLGTGLSSLRHLTQFNFGEVKVSRDFIRGVEHASVKQAVIKAILNIGGVRGARVVADGIETGPEHEILLDLGCTMGKGAFFSSPVPPTEFLDFIASEVCLPVKPIECQQLAAS